MDDTVIRLRRVAGTLKRYFKIFVLQDSGAAISQKWFNDKGDSTLRINYPLTNESIVFDVGGYKGDWADKISKKYDPFIFIFEPVPQYYQSIKNRFSNNSEIKVFNFGLSNQDKVEKISVLRDASSIYQNSEHRIQIDLRDIKSLLKDLEIKSVDLIKINIEGEEYELLKRIIETGMITKFSDIQVQFHNFFSDAPASREKIRNALQKTHSLTYDYPFVWENWRKDFEISKI
jgi:FkbM family methyltransferase